jgi:hypothetical protein
LDPAGAQHGVQYVVGDDRWATAESLPPSGSGLVTDHPTKTKITGKLGPRTPLVDAISDRAHDASER